MKNLLIAYRSLLQKGRHNIMKITSLSVGLAVGLVLIAKVYFEQSYDDFYPDGDRIYRLYEKIKRNNDLSEFEGISGGVVVGLKEEIPQIEAATRFTPLLVKANVTMVDTKQKYSINQMITADSCFFDFFPRKILSGEPKQVLSLPEQVMISDRLAKLMGGNVVGKQITPDEWPGFHLTIGGVFEEIPENSHLYGVDVVLSLVTYRQLMLRQSNGQFDGTMNWLGNDRYRGYIKLIPGVHPEELMDEIRTVMGRHIDLESLKAQSDLDLSYSFYKLPELHTNNPEVKRSMWLLSLLALALIFTAVMNYILIVVSSIINRVKEVSVRKCYGAGAQDIHTMVFFEALLHVLISVAVAMLLILTFSEVVEELLSVSVETLFLSKGSVVLALICVVVLLATGFIPGYLYARIPVIAAFRGLKENKRLWKLGLLSIQFVAAGFLLTLLVVIGRQYDYMTHDKPGYEYEEMAFTNLAGTDSTARRKVIDEMMRLPVVKKVTTCSQLLFDHASGNNIYLPGSDRELFNVADLYSCGEGYLEMMEIPIIEGRSFREGVTFSDEVMVSRSFVEKMSRFVDWSDGAVGKQILVSEHSGGNNTPFTICGVFEDFRLGSISSADERPKVLFYRSVPSEILVVQFYQLSAEAMAQAQHVMEQTFPNRLMPISSYRSEMINCYSDARRFRSAVLVGGLATLLISLIGLVGYTQDEVNRRRKEMAIRKINGATIREVIRMYLHDITRMALPALVIGGLIAYVIAGKWQEQFVEKAPLSWYIFLGCGVVVLAIILLVVTINSEKAARENPVNCLKSE